METYSPQHLSPTFYIDSDHTSVVEFAQRAVEGCATEREKAVALYLAVRDGLWYDPYNIRLEPHEMRASAVIGRGRGYCGEKATVLAAVARAVGIAARLEFADVKNHISSPRLVEHLRSDVFAFHGLTQLFVDGKWVKATPAFNKELCAKFNVAPLDFNGMDDSVFHEFDGGKKFMEYLHQHGTFDDLPREYFIGIMIKHYPHLFDPEAIKKLLWDWLLPNMKQMA